MTASQAPVTVGAFTFDPATGTLTGPAAFLSSADYQGWRARFEAGQDSVFAYGVTSGASPSTAVAMLVSVQTAYAAWHGRETFLHSLEGRRQS